MIKEIQDLRLVSKKVNARKIKNALKVYQSYISAKSGKGINHPAMPYALSVEPTTSCNLRCPECISGLRDFTRPTGMMSMDTFKKVIDELKNDLVFLTLYFQGEPLLNPLFFEFVNYASERGIYTYTSSNAHYFNKENSIKLVESGLDRIIVSMDGLDQISYEKYRIGGKLEKVIDGIKTLNSIKKSYKSKTPFIDLQFLAMAHNEHQLSEVENFGKELGVDRTLIKTAQINDFENGSELIPSDQKYSRYEANENGKFNIKNDLKNHCWKMWHSSVITWDGDVVPCCFDKDSNHKMGNIHEHSFKEIWNNEYYIRFREKLFQSRKNIDICRNCTEGTKVWK